jgi:uncharacterized membrane protein
MPETDTADSKPSADGSGLERLREEFTKYLMAKAEKLVSSAGQKTGDLAKRVEGKDGDGVLPSSVGDMLRGKSPVKAVGGQVAKTVEEKTVGKTKELFGGGGKAGEKKVTNIVETIDVGLPLRRVYDHWTEFEEFSGFMKGVVEASRSDDVTSDWTFKVGPSKRSCQATILEQVPDNRIVWETSGELSLHGGVSFHELTPDLTRVIAVVEYSPGGFLEKTANLWRAQGRRLRLDLKHFQRYVTLGVQEVPEGWRGEIREGELVRGHEDALADEERDAEGGKNGEAEEREFDEDEPAEDEPAEDKSDDAEADTPADDDGKERARGSGRRSANR